MSQDDGGHVGERFISSAQVADLLSVSRATIKNWRARGQLPPPCKINGTVRWPRSVITDWALAKQEGPS